jgi:photosystem II stability/assembly factor-like uncharacterized protein
MKRSSLLIVVALSLLTACGPTPTPTPDVAATNTAIAHVRSATLTAQAPTETPTQMPTSTATTTPTPTSTATSTPTPTHTVTNTPTATSTSTDTSTPTPADTPTNTPVSTDTPAPGPTPFAPTAEIETLGERRINSVAVDPTNSRVLYVAVQDEGVYKSVNGGASWGLVLKNESSAHITMDPTNPQVLYVGVWKGVSKTTDGGASWQTSQEGLTAEATIKKVVVAPANPRRVFAVSEFWAFGDSYESTDGGVSWHSLGTVFQKDPGFELRNVVSLAVDPFNERIIYVGGWSFWLMGDGPAQLFQGGPLKTTDGGRSWSFVGMTDELQHEREGQSVNPSALAFAIDPTNPQVVYATLDSGLFKSMSGGASWEYLEDLSGDPWLQGVRWVWKLRQNLFIHPGNPKIIFVGNGRVLRSTDGGTRWEEVLSNDFLKRGGGPHKEGQEFLYFASDFAFDHNDPQVIYASSWRGLLKSIDGGKTWEWM